MITFPNKETEYWVFSIIRKNTLFIIDFYQRIEAVFKFIILEVDDSL